MYKTFFWETCWMIRASLPQASHQPQRSCIPSQFHASNVIRIPSGPSNSDSNGKNHETCSPDVPDILVSRPPRLRLRPRVAPFQGPLSFGQWDGGNALQVHEIRTAKISGISQPQLARFSRCPALQPFPRCCLRLLLSA
jgi:hypothetical protein